MSLSDVLLFCFYLGPELCKFLLDLWLLVSEDFILGIIDLAHEFINFMLDDENALSNTEEVGYTSTVKSAFEEMKNGTYEGIDSYIPQIDNPKNEIFGYQKPKIKQKFAELWTKVKAK